MAFKRVLCYILSILMDREEPMPRMFFSLDEDTPLWLWAEVLGIYRNVVNEKQYQLLGLLFRDGRIPVLCITGEFLESVLIPVVRVGRPDIKFVEIRPSSVVSGTYRFQVPTDLSIFIDDVMEGHIYDSLIGFMAFHDLAMRMA